MKLRRVAVLTLIAIAAISLIPFLANSAEHTKDSLKTVLQNVTEKKAVIVDVREKSEWDAGHVKGAIFLPLSELKKGIDAEDLAKRLPDDKILYTHCVAGVRSVAAANILEQSDYKIRALKPGYKQLVQAGFPTSKE